jgi:hypothetical protein
MNTGTYSAFATTFGLKMYYFVVENKDRTRYGSDVPAGEYINAPKLQKTTPIILSPEHPELLVSEKTPPFNIKAHARAISAACG